MQRPSGAVFLAFLVLILAVQAALMFGKGILLIDQHEGDALHVLQIALRMGAGEWPHLDFTTPIGILAFAPISALISMGVGAGKAVMGGGVLVALLMLPAIWWVCQTRLNGMWGWLLGGFLILLVTALVYGGPVQVASISMYYNRWAWAVAFLLVLVTVLPGSRTTEPGDGLMLGFGLAFLVLSKVTFFVALLPAILVALILRQSRVTLGFGVLAGAVVALLMTLIGGVDFWAAYLGDLRLVSASGIRPAPSDGLAVLLIGPSFLAGNLCLLAGVILLRQAGHATEGLLLLLLAPAFVYITWQNWGNDPKWLILLAIVLMMLRPERHVNNAFGWDVGRAMGITALVSLALIAPTVVNLTFANLRHAQMARSGFFQVLPGDRNGDIAMQISRMYAPARREGFDLSDAKIAALVDQAVGDDADMLFGQPLGACKLAMGLVGVLHQMARDLEKVEGIAGATVFTADTFSNLWLFGSTRPLPGGAPWYYGGDAGLGHADFVLIPLCPVTPRARTLVLDEIAAQSDPGLTEVMRNDLFILLRRGNP